MTQSLNEESRRHIEQFADEALAQLERIATLHPALFDKYLYVGATYLGVTCQGSLPSAIESLRPHFCQDWQQGD
ncbi:hypothetical protein QM543_00420 [Pantoea eucrina]|uniref:hypothetical protein n=1 Tax=Pantoea eucrina TaxID=472693 RepID=UPI0024B7E6CE|nr:hypothetical protein [Pantoea eucrina]MDJ0021780.1 hypothetical protein [Pantoea eucrina]